MIEWLIFILVASTVLWVCLFALWCIFAIVLLGSRYQDESWKQHFENNIYQMRVGMGIQLMPIMTGLMNLMEEFIEQSQEEG